MDTAPEKKEDSFTTSTIRYLMLDKSKTLHVRFLVYVLLPLSCESCSLANSWCQWFWSVEEKW